MTLCKKCNGTGEITVPVEEHLGTVLYGTEQCDECDGTGEVQTNEEWLKQCNTEQLAEFISKIDMPFLDKAPFPCGDLIECNKNCGLYSRCVKDDFPTNKEVWVEWLKQPHGGES